MTYRILLRKEPTNGYVATALNWPDCQVSAPTREEALLPIQLTISQLLTSGELIDLEIPMPEIVSPYSDTFGLFKDDSTFTEFTQEMNRYRNERNQEFID